MAQELFANNAESSLASSVTSTGTTFTLVTGEGARFPAAVTGTSQFRAVLVDPTSGAILEYVTVTNRSTDTLTVTRESEDATRFPKASRAAGVKVICIASATALGTIAVPPGGTQNQTLVKSTNADYAVAWGDRLPAFGFASGSYYRPGKTLTAVTQFKDEIHYIPILIGKSTTFDRIGLEVTTGGSAGSVMRLGIYNAGTDGKPSTRLLDAGTINSTTTGFKEITISQTLVGMYFLSCFGSVADAGVRKAQALIAPINLGSTNTTSTVDWNGYYQDGTGLGGALPSTATPHASILLSSFPLVTLRAA